MNIVYPVIFTETGEKDVLVYIPDINGMTEGKGIADAIEMAKDYIGNALFGKKDSDVPKGRKIGEIDLKSSPFFGKGESFASLVDVDLDAEKTPSPRLADAMREALRISADPAVKGYADTKELFEALDA